MASSVNRGLGAKVAELRSHSMGVSELPGRRRRLPGCQFRARSRSGRRGRMVPSASESLIMSAPDTNLLKRASVRKRDASDTGVLAAIESAFTVDQSTFPNVQTGVNGDFSSPTVTNSTFVGSGGSSTGFVLEDDHVGLVENSKISRSGTDVSCCDDSCAITDSILASNGCRRPVAPTCCRPRRRSVR